MFWIKPCKTILKSREGSYRLRGNIYKPHIWQEVHFWKRDASQFIVQLHPDKPTVYWKYFESKLCLTYLLRKALWLNLKHVQSIHIFLQLGKKIFTHKGNNCNLKGFMYSFLRQGIGMCGRKRNTCGVRSFTLRGQGDETGVSGLGGKHLCLLGHLRGPVCF